MFYLKYRPKTIDQIDNVKAREVMENLMQTKNLPHAFLFVGQKGTGKTSTARIFAKAVNCQNNKFAGKTKDFNPCNHCKNCLSIDSGNSIDVVEMDAASNRGINEVKNLIHESSFSPMASRYRLFIIDEAHMITPDGFNALLKTIEEPPASVIFILATTNLEKVPKTIASRCLIVNFGKAKKEEIRKQLKRIIEAEKMSVPDDVITLITQHAEHSFRDAAKLLEELLIQNKLTYDHAKEYLGVRSKEDLLYVINTKSLKETLQWLEDFNQSGGSFKILIEELLEQLRLLLLKNYAIYKDDDLTFKFSTQEITSLMKYFTEAYRLLRISPIESLPLEIAVVEFYNQRNRT